MTLSSNTAHPFNEKAFLAAYEAGDRPTINRYLDLLGRESRRRLRRHVPRADVEDIAQDTQIAFFKALPSYRGTGSLAAFHRRIERNTIVNFRRKRAPNTVEYNPEVHRGVDLEWRTPLFEVACDAELRLLTEALEKLVFMLREVIELYFFDGLSTVEIAEILEIGVVTVRSRIHRARKELRKILGDEFFTTIPRTADKDGLDLLLDELALLLDD